MMIKQLFAAVIGLLCVQPPKRFKMRDSNSAFLYRMPAGFAGDINRTHPFEVEAELIDAAAPPLFYGIAVLIDATTQGVRPFAAGDTGVTVAEGLTVRPFPAQAPAGSTDAQQGIASAAPPISGVLDVMRNGLMTVKINTGQTAPVKGGAVYVWCAATAGNNVQSQFGTAASGGNTAALDVNRYTWNGGMDANNIAEIRWNV